MSTLTFIRNDRRNGFYYKSEQKEIEELSFVEAARIYKAVAGEKGVALHPLHHDQVADSIRHFQNSAQNEKVRGDVIDVQAGPNEKKAIKILATFINHPTLASAAEKTLLARAQELVKKNRYPQLQRKLNALQKEAKLKRYAASTFLDKVLKIVSEYVKEEEMIAPKNPSLVEEPSRDLNPAIILSESFVL